MRQCGLLHRGAHTLRHHECLGRAPVPYYEQELLAAEAIGGVAVPERTSHGRGHHAQCLVAGEMPEPVVVCLEAVDVAQREGEGVTELPMLRLDLREIVRKR